jgi:hypothetical protein
MPSPAASELERRDKSIDVGDFDVALDCSGDYFDDPTIQLTKFVSHDLPGYEPISGSILATHTTAALVLAGIELLFPMMGE